MLVATVGLVGETFPHVAARLLFRRAGQPYPVGPGLLTTGAVYVPLTLPHGLEGFLLNYIYQSAFFKK